MTKLISLPAAAVAAVLTASTPKRLKANWCDAKPVNIHIEKPRARTKSGMWPSDQDFSITADHVHEVPREVRVIPTGVLDENGSMLCRVLIPIKQQIGFFTGGNAWTGDAEEEVVLIQTADMIRFSDAGIGIESVDPSELEGYDDDDNEG